MAKAPKTSPSRRPWTSDDVKMLKSMARKEPASAIAKALKRTEGATRQKATALGVSLNTTRGRAAAAGRRPEEDDGPQGGAEEGRRREGRAEEGRRKRAPAGPEVPATSRFTSGGRDIGDGLRSLLRLERQHSADVTLRRRRLRLTSSIASARG